VKFLIICDIDKARNDNSDRDCYLALKSYFPLLIVFAVQKKQSNLCCICCFLFYLAIHWHLTTSCMMSLPGSYYQLTSQQWASTSNKPGYKLRAVVPSVN